MGVVVDVVVVNGGIPVIEKSKQTADNPIVAIEILIANKQLTI